MRVEKIEEKLGEIGSLLGKLLIFDSESKLIPGWEEWEENYQLRRKLAHQTMEKLINQVGNFPSGLIAAFKVCEEDEEFEWANIFLAETIVKVSQGIELQKVLEEFASTKVSSHAFDAIHDGLLKRGSEITPLLEKKVKKTINKGKGVQTHNLLSVLSKIRSDESFNFLKKLLDDEKARKILPDGDFLSYFLNQGKGVEIIKNSNLIESNPNKAKEIMKKIENGSYPTEKKLYQLPKIEIEQKNNPSILKEVWGYEATFMGDCVSCNKETKSHILPRGEVMCHTCWKEGKAEQIIEEDIKIEENNIREEIDDKEILKRLFIQLGEIKWEIQPLEEARTFYDTLLEKYPEKGVFIRYGELLHNAGETQYEEELYTRMTQIHPHDPTGYQQLGMLLNKKGAHEKAVPHLTRAINILVKKQDTFPGSNSWASISETVEALHEATCKTYPKQGKKEEKVQDFLESGLLDAQKEIFKSETKGDTPIRKLIEKLLEMKSLKRKIRLDKAIERENWTQGGNRLQEANFLSTLEELVSQYTLEKVLKHLYQIFNKLKTDDLHPFLLELLSRVDNPRAIPIQTYFLDKSNDQQYHSLLTALKKHEGTTRKFLKIELQNGRLPQNLLSSAWDLLREIDQETAINALSEYTKTQSIKPYLLKEYDWSYILDTLSNTSNDLVKEIYEDLLDQVKWDDEAYSLVQSKYENWKSKR